MRASPTVIALALMLGLAAVRPAAAQDVPTKGDWAVASQLFNSDLGTVFGVWRMLTDRLNLGLEVEARRGDSEEAVQSTGGGTLRGNAETWTFNIGPSLKWYGMRDGPVSPYLRTKVSIGWESAYFDQGNQVAQDRDGSNYQASLALGAEWYPIKQLAIGGHTGFQYLHSDFQSTENGGVTQRDRDTVSFGTFRSGLELFFFFR